MGAGARSWGFRIGAREGFGVVWCVVEFNVVVPAAGAAEGFCVTVVVVPGDEAGGGVVGGVAVEGAKEGTHAGEGEGHDCVAEVCLDADHVEGTEKGAVGGGVAKGAFEVVEAAEGGCYYR